VPTPSTSRGAAPAASSGSTSRKTRWRSDFRADGARRFADVVRGLNQMTVRRFRALLADSDFRVAEFRAVPIRRLRWLANPLTREWLTSTVRCRLVA